MANPPPYPTPATVTGTRPAVARDSEAIDLTGGNVTFTGAYPDAIRVDGAGTVEFVTRAGTTDTWTCVAGDIIPVVVTQIIVSGTSATGLHALYTSSNTHS